MLSSQWFKFSLVIKKCDTQISFKAWIPVQHGTTRCRKWSRTTRTCSTSRHTSPTKRPASGCRRTGLMYSGEFWAGEAFESTANLWLDRYSGVYMLVIFGGQQFMANRQRWARTFYVVLPRCVISTSARGVLSREWKNVSRKKSIISSHIRNQFA